MAQNTDYMQFFNRIMYVIENKNQESIELDYEQKLLIQNDVKLCFNSGVNYGRTEIKAQDAQKLNQVMSSYKTNN